MANPSAPQSAATADTPLTGSERNDLLRIAVQSIVHGLDCGTPLNVVIEQYSARLAVPQACFVTLRRGDDLRGCVGTLEATLPLARQVATSAYHAAFRDTRLESVHRGELAALTLEISLLSPLEELPAANDQDLLNRLRPGVDGVVVSEGARYATFLPKVWDTFALPFDFVAHLKRKAGLPPRYWSPTLRWQRYTAQSFGADIADIDRQG
jgi:AmmeMemoRadiSam system protein A